MAMPIDRLRPLVGTALLAGLAGCADPGAGTLPYTGGEANFGEANRQTMAAQVIDPMPTYDTLVSASSGEQAAAAIERYRTDKVKVPTRGKVSDVGESSGKAPD